MPPCWWPPQSLADRGTAPPAGPTASQAADIIYTGGDIVTINDAQPSVEALAVKDGKILDKNPLKVEPMAIKDVAVVETIKEGKSIYKR